MSNIHFLFFCKYDDINNPNHRMILADWSKWVKKSDDLGGFFHDFKKKQIFLKKMLPKPQFL